MAKDGGLCVRYREGETAGRGHLEDYAYYGWALIELYEATLQPQYLEQAITVTRDMLAGFGSDDGGGLYLSHHQGEALILRPREVYDGALPSGNGVAAYNLVRLARLTQTDDLNTASAAQMSLMAGAAGEHPEHFTLFLMAALFETTPARELHITLAPDEQTAALLKLLHGSYMPNTLFAADLSPVADGNYPLINGQTTFYLCQNNACSPPFNGIDTLRTRL